MPSSVIAEQLAELNDRDLAAWLRALDVLVADARQANMPALAGWYCALRRAGEADQRWRKGGTAPLVSWESELVTAAQQLGPIDLDRLGVHYQAVFEGRLGIPFKHPAAMIAGVCAIVLELVRETRQPAPAA